MKIEMKIKQRRIKEKNILKHHINATRIIITANANTGSSSFSIDAHDCHELVQWNAVSIRCRWCNWNYHT